MVGEGLTTPDLGYTHYVLTETRIQKDTQGLALRGFFVNLGETLIHIGVSQMNIICSTVLETGYDYDNMWEDTNEQGFEIQVTRTLNCFGVMTKNISTRWVAFDDTGAYIVWSSWDKGNRYLAEKDISEGEEMVIERMVDSHVEILAHRELWA
jgi:hypothetical protein